MSATPESTNPDAYGRLDVTVREASFEAGKISPVTIILRNPFDVPVEVLEIQGPRSYHVHEIDKARPPSLTGADGDQLNGSSAIPKESFVQRFRRDLGRIRVAEISVGPITAHLPTADRSFNIEAEPNSEIVIDRDVSTYESVNVKALEGAKVHFTREEVPEGAPQPGAEPPDNINTFTIEPHCETVAYFEISTTGWLFFTPTRQSLSTLVRYRISGREKTQVTTSEFEVKPPLAAMVIGAIIGAVLGSVAKVLNSGGSLEWQPVLVAVGGSVVMSLIAAIALSRKTGTQGFITVEDFFGGFVIGALIGYGGSEYFEKAIVPPDVPNGAG